MCSKRQPGFHATYKTVPYNLRPLQILSRENGWNPQKPTGIIRISHGICREYPLTPVGTVGTQRNLRQSSTIPTDFLGFPPRECPRTPVGTLRTHRNPRQLYTIPTVFHIFHKVGEGRNPRRQYRITMGSREISTGTHGKSEDIYVGTYGKHLPNSHGVWSFLARFPTDSSGNDGNP